MRERSEEPPEEENPRTPTTPQLAKKPRILPSQGSSQSQIPESSQDSPSASPRATGNAAKKARNLPSKGPSRSQVSDSSQGMPPPSAGAAGNPASGQTNQGSTTREVGDSLRLATGTDSLSDRSCANVLNRSTRWSPAALCLSSWLQN